MRGRSVSGVLRSGKDDPVREVGNQMHGIQDHHASHIVSEAGFEVDGGFLLHLVVILTDPLDDWIGDQTGEQEPWRWVRLRCQFIRAFLLCSSDDGNRPVIVTDWRAWTLMCYSSGTGDFSSRRRLDQTAADPESSVATPTGRRVLKHFITAEVRRSSLQRVADESTSLETEVAAGRLATSDRLLRKSCCEENWKGNKQPRALLNVDGYDNCSKS